MEVILTFPLSLLWGMLVYFALKPSFGRVAFVAGVAAISIAPLLIPPPFDLYVWLPGGVMTVVSVAVLMSRLRLPGAGLAGALDDPKPVLSLQKALQSAADPEQKRSAYIRMVSEMARLWQHKDKLLRVFHTRLTFAAILLPSVISGAFQFLDYQTGRRIPAMMRESVSSLPGIKDRPELLDQFTDVIIRFAPTLVLYQNAVMVLAFFLLLRSAGHTSRELLPPVPSLKLFVLPSWSMFIFLAGLAGLWIGFRGWGGDLIFLAAANVTLILVFLYFLQGTGTVLLFLEIRGITIRWLPVWIGIAALLFWAIVGPLLLFVAVGAVILGAGDIWFNFRKRALQPEFLTNSDG